MIRCRAEHVCVLQISNIRIIKEAMREASFLYAELAGFGAPMRFCDVGGGLAIDYEVPFSSPGSFQLRTPRWVFKAPCNGNGTNTSSRQHP